MLRNFTRLSTMIMVSLLCACEDNEISPGDIIADVAVYSGSGSWEASVTAACAAVKWAGFTVDTVAVGLFFSDDLYRYRAILFPGGDPREMLNALGLSGNARIRAFVGAGGAFIGLGGGSAIADSGEGIWEGVGLFNGWAQYPLEIIAVPPEYAITNIQLFGTLHPIGMECASHYQTLYYGGPQFSFSVDEPVAVIFNYVATGRPAAIAFQYRSGRVFLAGFQPEIEENSDRDSTNFGADLNDPDSEWEIIQQAVSYCLWEL